MFGMSKRNAQPGTAPAPSAQGDPAIAALLLDRTSYPLDWIQERLSNRALIAGTPQDIQLKDGILHCRAGDEMIAISLMPAPYPWRDLEGPCQTAWMYPDALAKLKDHRAHLLAVLIGGKSPAPRRRQMLTEVVCLLADQPEVIGVHWAEGTIVHRPDVFMQMAEAMKEIYPLWLWVDMRVWQESNGTMTLATTGMERLGKPEIEIVGVRAQPGALREFVLNIGNTLLTDNPPLKEGEQVADMGTAKLYLHLAKSVWDRPGRVIRLDTRR